MIIMQRDLNVTRDKDDHLIYKHPGKGILAIGWAPPATSSEPPAWGACYYASSEHYEDGRAERRWAASSRWEFDRLVECFLNTGLDFAFDRFSDFVEHELALPPRHDDQDDFMPDFDDEGRPYHSRMWDPYRSDEE